MSEPSEGKITSKDSENTGGAQQDLAGLLNRAIELVKNLGAEFDLTAENLSSLRDRMETESFHLAVLGQFKRGKSTFLNALLGKEILPTSVIPLTAIPTFVRWDPSLKTRIVYQDDRPPEEFEAADEGELGDFLSRFVTEESNPENHLGVLQAEVFHPAKILEKGLVLIDTPGIGSTYQHNTETTLNFLPQCDSALFLVSADPPVTEVELTFLKEVRKKISRLFFIFNKVDYLRDTDREKALDFFKNFLTNEVGMEDDFPVFPLSARDGLEARINGDEAMLTASGLPGVQKHLVEFLMHEKSRVLHGAIARKAEDIIAQVLMQEELKMRSLQMPIANLEERLGTLKKKIEEARYQRTTAGDLLTGDRKRSMELLENQSEDLRDKARDYLEELITAALAGGSRALSLEKAARQVLSDSIPGFFEHELGTLSSEFDRHVTEVLKPHQVRADELIEAVRMAAAELFEVPYHAPESSETFHTASQPYWITHKWNTSMNPIPAGLFDWILPFTIRRSVSIKRLMKQVDDLVLHNVENLRWATLQNLDSAFRKFTGSLDEGLRETIDATYGAIKAVIDQRKEHEESTAESLSEIESATAELSDLLKGFAGLLD